MRQGGHRGDHQGEITDTPHLRWLETLWALAMSPPTPTSPTARTASACSATALA